MGTVPGVPFCPTWRVNISKTRLWHVSSYARSRSFARTADGFGYLPVGMPAMCSFLEGDTSFVGLVAPDGISQSLVTAASTDLHTQIIGNNVELVARQLIFTFLR
jgi:hypothetical protein